jgi:hypothetical protein
MKAYRHTKKAINRGCPADRIFIQVSTQDGDPVAWKCTLVGGRLICPWDKTSSLDFDDACKAAPLVGTNGSEPTAWFKVDSYYKEITTI